MLKWYALVLVIAVLFSAVFQSHKISDGEEKARAKDVFDKTIDIPRQNTDLALSKDEEYKSKPKIEAEVSELDVSLQVSLSQFHTLIYEGQESEKWNALSYATSLEHQAMPALLHLIYGNNELALKEQAIAILADIDPPLFSKLVNKLQDDPELQPILLALGVTATKTQLSDYSLALRRFETRENQDLIHQLGSQDATLKVLAVERLKLDSDASHRKLLEWVAVNDNNSKVRIAAIKAGLFQDAENRQAWLKRALRDSDSSIQTYVLIQISSYEESLTPYLSDLMAVIHRNPESSVAEQAMSLLSSHPMVPEQDMLSQVRVNQSRSSSN